MTDLGLALYELTRSALNPMLFGLLAMIAEWYRRKLRDPAGITSRILWRVSLLGATLAIYSLDVIAWMSMHGGPIQAASHLGELGWGVTLPLLPTISLCALMICNAVDGCAGRLTAWLDRVLVVLAAFLLGEMILVVAIP